MTTREPRTDWTDLANDIRRVDGNHDLGAGALAEALIERGWTKAAAPDAALRELLIENTDALVGWIRESGDEARARHIVEELDAALAREPQPRPTLPRHPGRQRVTLRRLAAP